jgi:hypothetical protein
MEVTLFTWIIGVAALLLMGVLMAAQLAAVIRLRAEWNIENVYAGDPGDTDPKA